MKFLVGVFALAILVAACGNDDDGGSSGDDGGGSALSSAIAAGLLEDPPDGVGEEEANCMADGIVSAVGEGRLIELGINADTAADLEVEDLDPEVQEAMADVFVACADIRGVFVDTFREQIDLSDESAQCISDAISDDQLRAIALSGIRDESLDDSLIGGELIQAVLGCLSPEELTELGG